MNRNTTSFPSLGRKLEKSPRFQPNILSRGKRKKPKSGLLSTGMMGKEDPWLREFVDLAKELVKVVH